MTNRVDAYFEELGGTYRSVVVTDARGPMPFYEGIEALLKLSFSTHANGRKLMFVGNGGSAGTASHMAVDAWKNGGLRATAFNDASLLTCLANDYGYEHVFEKTIAMMAQPGDLLLTLSASGRSPNILRAVAAARERACAVVTLSGFTPDNPLRALGDLNFYVPSGAYGFVEMTHLAICHCLVDFATAAQGSGA
jgi:D-sedoheptulose 7-phosphate isomerase